MTRPAPRVPPPLVRGDRVAVVAPAFPPRDPAALCRGIGRLEGWGLAVRRGASLRARHGYLAGTDALRAADLQRAIDDDGIRGILFARGGWGTSRIIDRLDLSRLRTRPKVLLGYSDLTVFFHEAWRRCGLVCSYGPVVAELGRPRSFHAPSLERALFRPTDPMELSVGRRSVLRAGRAGGILLGGCLTLLAHLCGSSGPPVEGGAVLFVEEVGEEPYRVDRMLWQLRRAGVLDRVAAVAVGQMTGCRPRRGMRSPTVREVLADHLLGLKVPVLLDLPAGHGSGKWTLPLGFHARVDGSSGTLRLAPAPGRGRR